MRCGTRGSGLTTACCCSGATELSYDGGGGDGDGEEEAGDDAVNAGEGGNWTGVQYD